MQCNYANVYLMAIVQFICCNSIAGYPQKNDEIVMVEEAIRYSDLRTNTSGTLITFAEEFDGGDIADDVEPQNDDLIVLTNRPLAEQQQLQQQTHFKLNKQIATNQQQIDLFTSDVVDSLTPATAAASVEQIDGKTHEIELRNCVTVTTETTITTTSKPATAKEIDMSDFLALIPVAEVKTIVANYYQNDPEVQQAYAYLNSADFQALKEHILATPETTAFLRYLKASGLDVASFIYAVTNITSTPMTGGLLVAMNATHVDSQTEQITTDVDNEIVNRTYSTTQRTPTTTIEQITGLHGLVDSILEVLPQSEILATFFEKFENDEQFSKLVERISTPAFAKIISNLQNSMALRNLIFTLHNNGIYITKIVDSLKAYFFLGTF